MPRADNRPVGQRVRHDQVGPRREPDAAFRSMRVLVLSALAGGEKMNATEIWHATGARQDAQALLPRVLDDLVERCEVETWRGARCRFYALPSLEH